jgi:hypothetical protein
MTSWTPARPLPLHRREAAVARDAQDTSREAARLTIGRSGNHRSQVVAYIVSAPHQQAGRTDDEIEAATGLSHQTVSARRRGLVLDGWLEEARDEQGRPIRRRTRSNTSALVWTLTPKGRAQWEADH